MDGAAGGSSDPSARGGIEAVVRRLSPAAARLYPLLGLHPTAEFDRWAATAAMGGDDAAARSGLAELLRNGLVGRVDGIDGRYRMSETVHDHARSGAHTGLAAGDALNARQRYISYYVSGAIAADARSAPGRREDVPVAVDRPDTPDLPTAEAARTWMRDNLPAVLAVAEWAQDADDHAPVWRIAEASDGFLRDHGRSTDRTALTEMGIRSAEAAGNAAAEARLRILLGRTLVELGRPAEAAEEFSRSLTLSEGLADGRGRGAALECLGVAAQRAGDDEVALRYFDRALPFREAMGRPEAMAALSLLRSRSLISLGRFDDALEPLNGAIGTFRAGDGTGGRDAMNEAEALLERGRALDGKGEPDQARIALRRALDIFTEGGSAHGQARVHEVLARVEGGSAQAGGAAYAEHRDAARDLRRGLGDESEHGPAEPRPPSE
ncbi:tetratricopeptide repeat protein [Nocardiopsis mangrovi]|uniref:Tetratricopeptide repeat protein n=1 Tax=Nocardiopsis mangrovi TaxID=1179818 RepID=A0ABV9E7H5_9ACTN